MQIPPLAQVDETLARLGVHPDDRAEMLAAGPPTQHPELTALLAQRHGELVQGMGGLGILADWPALDPALYGSVQARYFYVWLYVVAIPELRRFHQSRGISEDMTWAAMAELGGQMDYRRRIWGEGGLHAQSWMTVHFRGANYRIGRLVFERARSWFSAGPVRPGDPVIGVHIPRGRLTPQSCDEAFEAARKFFARHFPEERYQAATCVSWVLDPQLRSYLRPDSNILTFQRRFELLPYDQASAVPADTEIIEAVFARRRPETAELGSLPSQTSLERGIVDHLRAGGHWYYRPGWCAW